MRPRSRSWARASAAEPASAVPAVRFPRVSRASYRKSILLEVHLGDRPDLLKRGEPRRHAAETVFSKCEESILERGALELPRGRAANHEIPEFFGHRQKLENRRSTREPASEAFCAALPP